MADHYRTLLREYEKVRDNVLKVNGSQYAVLAIELAKSVVLPTEDELVDATPEDMEAYTSQIQDQPDGLLETIEAMEEAAKINLTRVPEEKLELVVSLVDEEPWEELYPESKAAFHSMNDKQIAALCDFYGIKHEKLEEEITEDHMKRLTTVLGI